MRWYWQCAVDAIKAGLPFQEQLRGFRYRAFGYHADTVKDGFTIRAGLYQADWIRKRRGIEDAVILEIGSGWQPAIPILFSLAGAREVLLTDQVRLCMPDSFQAALASLHANKALILERLGISADTFARALDVSKLGLDDAFRHLRLRYLAPCDCASLDLPAASVDVVTSRAVLEHIPPDVIRAIFQESRRILKPAGFMVHSIDNSDHWRQLDSSISWVNFLQYSDAAFRWTNLHPQRYQNRLRHSEYRAMLLDAGFRIEAEEGEPSADALAALESLRLAERFRGMDKRDLAILFSWFLAVVN